MHTKKKILFHLTLFFLMAVITFSLSPAVYAASTADTSVVQNEATIEAPSSRIETVPADTVPTKQAPSSKGTQDTMAILLEFVVLWSIIYIIIKVVRRKLDEQKKIR